MVKLKLNTQTNEWDELPKGSREEGSIYMDGMLFRSVKKAKGVMQKKSVDLVIVCTGYPGSGKSKLISQVASVCDPSFNENRMFQKTADFQKAVEDETEILKAYVLDEAWDGLSSSQVRREAGRLFMNLLNVIRQKRLFIFIVLPDFFDLSKQISIFRSRWLIHCYSESFGDIGRFVAFDRKSKKQLYLKGKQTENYNAHPSDFKGVFTDASPPNFNWERYENIIKPKAMVDQKEKSNDVRESVAQRDRLLLIMKKKYKWTIQELSDLMDMHYNHVSRLVAESKRREGSNFIKDLTGGKY